jgi:hypothetical protein
LTVVQGTQPPYIPDGAGAMTVVIEYPPGGELIQYSDANNRDDVKRRFVVTMLCVPGAPMLTLVDEDELAARKHLRFAVAGDA